MKLNHKNRVLNRQRISGEPCVKKKCESFNYCGRQILHGSGAGARVRAQPQSPSHIQEQSGPLPGASSTVPDGETTQSETLADEERLPNVQKQTLPLSSVPVLLLRSRGDNEGTPAHSQTPPDRL